MTYTKTTTLPSTQCGWKPQPACAPKFQYKGQTYTGCTTVDHDMGWCSHNAVYSGVWSECVNTCVRLCSAAMGATVVVGEVSARVSPGADLPSGMREQYDCARVNAQYTGTIQL